MGLFSYDCRGCGHPLISLWRTEGINDWMAEGVVQLSDGQRYRGLYDGYGRLDLQGGRTVCVNPYAGGEEVNPKEGRGHFFPEHMGKRPTETPEVWHAHCFLIAGEPEWSGSSDMSCCQGGLTCDRHHHKYPPFKLKPTTRKGTMLKPGDCH